MRYVTAALLTLLAMIGAQVGSASAATRLELSDEGGALEAGAGIETSSSGMIIRTSAGNVMCNESVMEGTVAANDKVKDELQLTSAAFRRTHHVPAAECESSIALGEPTVTAGGLPWTATLTTKGIGKTHGVRKGKMTFTLQFPEESCVMEGGEATNAFDLPQLGEEAIPLELSISGLALKLAKGGPGCPKSGTFEEPAIAVSDQAQTSDKTKVKTTKRGKK